MSLPATPRAYSETDAQDLLLARAALCRFLRLGLAPPDRRNHETLCSAATWTAMELAARTLDRTPNGELLAAAEAFEADPAWTLAEARKAHRHLFGHTLRGRVCPYECEYGRRPLLQQAQELADLAGFYRAFGLRPSRRRPERPDHVACELEFLEFLSVKEALALERRDDESREVTRGAVRRLLMEHLGRFGRAFARSLAEAAPERFHGRLGVLLEAFLVVECERLELPLGPAMLELRAEVPDQTPMACGSDDELVRLGDG